MATHLFAVGERVSLSAAMRNTRNFSTVFTVKNRLPHVGTRLQYRIRAEAEPHDRVVTEEQLSRRDLRASRTTRADTNEK